MGAISITMRNRSKIVFGFSLTIAIGALLWLLAGCSVVGKNPSPPTKLESGLFDVKTNYVPVVVAVTEYKTNVLQVTQIITNTAGVTLTVTNWTTNTVSTPALQTNLQAQYFYDQGAGAQTVKGVAGGIGALFGAGGLASTAASLLLGVWGWARSSKNYQTAANTAQVVETIRQFIKQLPNGSNYDAALVQFMTQHQADAGVLSNVVQLLANEVSNPDAKVAADSILATLNKLGVTIPQTPGKI